MGRRDLELLAEFESGISDYEAQRSSLAGLRHPATREAFVHQLLDSSRRVRYIEAIRGRDLSPLRADPRSDLFDPIKASIIRSRMGETEEASWLVFLFVHFGKHRRGGYRYSRDIYGRLGSVEWWTWERVSADAAGFRDWLAQNEVLIHTSESAGGFGNHRKYESLSASSSRGTGAAVKTYVDWVLGHGSHEQLFESAIGNASGSGEAFEILYTSMDSVARFGRVARFDYLTMIAKLGLADIRPASPYLRGSTGPLAGARLLFANDPHADLSTASLDSQVVELEGFLDVGMQVMEDALCNWQKSPGKFIRFAG